MPMQSSTVCHQPPYENTKPLQNICAKLILNKNRYSSSSWALKKLHWLPIQQKIEYKILMTTFKCITGMAPKYLQDLINIKNNTWDNMCSSTLAPHCTHQKSSTIPLQHGPSGIPHQHCRISYQSSSKIHQTMTPSRRSSRHISSSGPST